MHRLALHSPRCMHYLHEECIHSKRLLYTTESCRKHVTPTVAATRLLEAMQIRLPYVQRTRRQDTFVDRIYYSMKNMIQNMKIYVKRPNEIDVGFARNFKQKYIIHDCIGEGAFGTVHLCSPTCTNTKLDQVVKIIPKGKIITYTDLLSIKREAEVMYLLGGTLNVVHHYGSFEDDENIYLVLEHCAGGEMLSRFEDTHSNCEELIRNYMQDIIHVVHQCHCIGVVHRDLKLENFLFAEQSKQSAIKLTDFGGAQFIIPGHTVNKLVGTPLYNSPEMLQGEYSFPTDIW